MTQSTRAYTYDSTRKLGALIPLEAEKPNVTNPKISQVLIDEIREIKNEESWTVNDVATLRAAALCQIKNFHRTLFKKIKDNGHENYFTGFNREDIAVNIMKGMSVKAAFERDCGTDIFNELMTLRVTKAEIKVKEKKKKK